MREDITCKSPLCEQCVKFPTTNTNSNNTNTSNTANNNTNLFSDETNTYLIPDASTLNTYFDIFLLANFVNVIVLRSVFHQLKYTYRMRRTMNEYKRHYILFENENFEKTFAKERKERVATTAKWFGTHLQHTRQPTNVVVLSEEETTVQILKAAGVEVLSLGEYLPRVNASKQVQDLYSTLQAEAQRKKDEEEQQKNAPGGSLVGKNNIYAEHLPDGIVWQGLKEQQYLRATLQVSSYFPSLEAKARLCDEWRVDLETGKVLPKEGGDSDSSGGAESVLICEMINRNRAMDGDEVAIELLPRSEWKSFLSKRHLASEDEGEAKDNNDNNNEKEVAEARTVVPTGRVVAIIDAKWRPLVCTMQLQEGANSNTGNVLCVPMDRRFPKIRINTRQDLTQDRLLVHIDTWDCDSHYPAGHVVKKLGPIDDIETGVTCILIDHQISHPPFTPQQLAHLPLRPEKPVSPKLEIRDSAKFYEWTAPAEALVGRRDLRDTLVCSIDPLGCEDIEDRKSVV